MTNDCFDAAALWERVNGDIEILREIVSILAEQEPRMLENIESAIRQGNAAGLREAGHMLKGSLLQFSATQAASLAGALEDMGESGSLEAAPKVFAQLREETKSLQEALNRMVCGGPVAEVARGDGSVERNPGPLLIRESPPNGQPRRPLRVLLVEDNPVDARFVMGALAAPHAHDLRCHHASGLGEALLLLRAEHFDVVLLDLNLNDSAGYDTFVSAHRAAPDAAILVLSSSDDEYLAVRTVHGGAQDYLVKGSFDQRLLIRSIRYALERQQSEETVRSIFENSPDALLILAEDETCKAANSAAAALLGVPQPEMSGRSIAAFIESDSREKWESVRASRTGRGTFWVVRQDQTCRLVDCCFSANIVPGSHLCALRDITEQHSLEQQLRLSQKMEAVGRLAAGLAHDFNNILGVISSCAELMQMKATDASLIAKTGKILAATQKAATLTKQLLAFGCKQFIAPTLLDVSAVLAGIDSVVTCLTGAKIQVTVQTGEKPGLVKADPGQMEQVILNLVSNAADAMPNGGTLAIRVENYKTSGADPQLPAGDYVLVAVSDTGVGMDEKLQSLIFEPFFSTKQNGSGLGLSTVYGIIQQVGGYITLQSAPNEGSTFRLFFPVASATGSESLQEEPPPTAPTKRKETILVADDEDELRNSVGEYLETCGYCVLQARDGEEAITILDSHAEPIAAVITDLVMPKVDGRGLIDHVRKKHPETGILVISGYAGDAAVRHGFFLESAFFLEKPFALDSLDSKIRNLLDRTA